jgi:hypothetical protein
MILLTFLLFSLSVLFPSFLLLRNFVRCVTFLCCLRVLLSLIWASRFSSSH